VPKVESSGVGPESGTAPRRSIGSADLNSRTAT
jgi:hypothetical protein